LKRLSNDFSESIVTTPAAPPISVAVGDPSCITCGNISVAAAAKTTPAARCWRALVSLGPGGRNTATTAPASTARSGKTVYVSASMMRS
jgi:hypothetical protein